MATGEQQTNKWIPTGGKAVTNKEERHKKGAYDRGKAVCDYYIYIYTHHKKGAYDRGKAAICDGFILDME